MKKLVSLLVALALFLSMPLASATDLGVTIISTGNKEAEPVSLDDIKLGTPIKIDGFAKIAPVSFEYLDSFYQYSTGMKGDTSTKGTYDKPSPDSVLYEDHNIDYYFNSIFRKFSGQNADFAWLQMDVTNLTKEAVEFTEISSVKVVYDEEYEYQGWIRQFNYDYDAYDKAGSLIRAALDPADVETLEIVYTGHYIFGCTLPNEVVTGKEPLKMIIMLGDNEITYHIRK